MKTKSTQRVAQEALDLCLALYEAHKDDTEPKYWSVNELMRLKEISDAFQEAIKGSWWKEISRD
jgi:hypothetical protein